MAKLQIDDQTINVPIVRNALTIFFILLALLLVGLGIAVIRHVIGWGAEAAQVAQEQVGPRALLKKYEWFKDAHAQLDAKRANIRVYQARLADLDKHPSESRTREETRSQWISEKAGVVASYNDLAAEYNAQMAKANYAFCNVGALPQGATEPLPRNVAPYSEGN